MVVPVADFSVKLCTQAEQLRYVVCARAEALLKILKLVWFGSNAAVPKLEKRRKLKIVRDKIELL